MAEVGLLLRRLHDEGARVVPADEAVWMPWTLRDTGPGTVVSHGNFAPWQVVFRHGLPVAFIGWEYAGPLHPVREVAATGWYCAQLFDDDVAVRTGLPDVITRGTWLKAFLDGYGLSKAMRRDLVTLRIEFAIADTGEFARKHDFSPESREAGHLSPDSRARRRGCWNVGKSSLTSSPGDEVSCRRRHRRDRWLDELSSLTRNGAEPGFVARRRRSSHLNLRGVVGLDRLDLRGRSLVVVSTGSTTEAGVAFTWSPPPGGPGVLRSSAGAGSVSP